LIHFNLSCTKRSRLAKGVTQGENIKEKFQYLQNDEGMLQETENAAGCRI